MEALYTCTKCGQGVTLSPSLSKRMGSDGGPMTKAEALQLFRDAKGGMCSRCYVDHRTNASVELMRRLSAK